MRRQVVTALTMVAIGLVATAAISQTDEQEESVVLKASRTGLVVYPTAVAPGDEVVAIIDVPYVPGVKITSVDFAPTASMMRNWQEGDPTRMTDSPFDWSSYTAELQPDGKVVIAFTMPATHVTVHQPIEWDLTRWRHIRGASKAFVRRGHHHINIQLKVRPK
jgi:hypothetical protein